MLETPENRDQAIISYLDSFSSYDAKSNGITANLEVGDDAKNKNEIESINLHEVKGSIKRTHCCGSSCCIYCPECCKLFITQNHLPPPLRDKNENILKLPFQLDVVLDDRRRVCTGLHAFVLFGNNERDVVKKTSHNQYCKSNPVNIIDLEKEDSIPNYNDDYDSPLTTSTNPIQEANKSVDHTFVLFPSKDSIPLSSVARSIKRLIVLDCKWTRTRSANDTFEKLSNLTKVHLTSPPISSHYWRWHNAGPGRISSIEAIYCAAWEVCTAIERTNTIDNVQEINTNNHSILRMENMIVKEQNSNQNHFIHQEKILKKQPKSPTTSSAYSSYSLLHILFLFGLQRAMIKDAALKEGRSLPYSEKGKNEQRALRENKPTHNRETRKTRRKKKKENKSK